MSFIGSKILSVFSIWVSLVVITLWASALFASSSDSIAGVRKLAVGVQQTDPLVIYKLPDIEFEQPLAVVTVPKQDVTRVSSLNTPVTVATAMPSATEVKIDKSEGSLRMNDELASEDVSAALLAKFNRALKATNDDGNIPEYAVVENYNAVPIADLPQHLRVQIPSINYSSHVYSSKSRNRSIRLNNRDLREGSWLTDDIEVLEILQNEVIMRVGPQSFSLKALADWSA